MLPFSGVPVHIILHALSSLYTVFIRQAKSSGPQPFYQIVVTPHGQPNGIILYESVLLPHCVINVLYEAFCAFVTNCENQVLI